MVGRPQFMRGSMKTFTAAIVSLLVMAAPAAAQTVSPTVTGYSQPGASIQTQITPQSGVSPSVNTSTPSTPSTNVSPAVNQTTPATTGRSLPFTGLEVGLVVLAGVLLLGVGLVVRRVVRPAQSA